MKKNNIYSNDNNKNAIKTIKHNKIMIKNIMKYVNYIELCMYLIINI